MSRRLSVPLAALALYPAATLLPGSTAHADTNALCGYLVVLADAQPSTPGFQLADADRQAALAQLTTAGGTLSKTIGVVYASSSLTAFASTLEPSSLGWTPSRATSRSRRGPPRRRPPPPA